MPRGPTVGVQGWHVFGQQLATQQLVQLPLAQMIGLIQVHAQSTQGVDRGPERGMQRFVIQGIGRRQVDPDRLQLLDEIRRPGRLEVDDLPPELLSQIGVHVCRLVDDHRAARSRRDLRLQAFNDLVVIVATHDDDDGIVLVRPSRSRICVRMGTRTSKILHSFRTEFERRSANSNAGRRSACPSASSSAPSVFRT